MTGATITLDTLLHAARNTGWDESQWVARANANMAGDIRPAAFSGAESGDPAGSASSMIAQTPDEPAALDAAFAPAGLTYEVAKARAAALTEGDFLAADLLMANIASAQSLSDLAFKPLSAAIAKTTKFDAAAIGKKMMLFRVAMTGQQSASRSPRICDDPEAALDPKPLPELANHIVRIINGRVQCSPDVACAVALWIIGTWGLRPPSDPDDGPDWFPRLYIGAPAKRCGKSLLLETVMRFVRRGLSATDMSESAMFRAIRAWSPTLGLDEFDALLAKVPALRGIINSGAARDGVVVRSTEVQRGGVRGFEPELFPVFTALVLAGIGRTASTIEDRSIRLWLQRQAPAAGRKRIGLRQLSAVQAIMAPHLFAHADAIGAAMAGGVPDSAIPTGLNDRDADNWRPLLAIAALMGGTWPDRARRAAVALCLSGSDEGSGPEATLRQVMEGIQALRAEAVGTYRVWRWQRDGKHGPSPVPPSHSTTTTGLGIRPTQHRPPQLTFVPSEALAAWLMAKDDSGFADARDTGTVKQRLARQLKPFSIEPVMRRPQGGQPMRGYEVRELRAVWRQYRP